MSLVTNLSTLSTRVATELKAHKTFINGNVTDLSSLNTTAKGNLVAAINEVYGAVAGAGASINDTGTSGASVWSSSKTNTAINTAVSNLVASAPSTLDTLKELSDALGADANFATTMTTALAGKASTVHTHTASQISDATTVGKAVMTATDAAAARTAIGAGTGSSSLVIGTTSGTAADAAVTISALATKGTSSLVIGTTSGTAADAAVLATSLAGKAPTTHTHTASQISDATTIGKAVLTSADATAVRTAIGAGTSSLVIGTSSGTAADAAVTISALATKGTSSLVIGTASGTAADAAVTITALAGKAATSHTHTASQISDSTTVGRAVLVATDAATARAAIGAGVGSSSLVIGTTSGTAADAALVGDTTTNFVTTFEAGLV